MAPIHCPECHAQGRPAIPAEPCEHTEQQIPEGYHPCTCRDCFEIAIGPLDGGLCWECVEAGCEAGAEGECRAPGAYGGEDEEDAEP